MQKLKFYADQITKQARLDNQTQNSVAPEKDIELIGLMGEYAAALYFDIKYVFNTKYDAGRSDLLNGLEVRTTNYANGHLITHDTDKTALYILAIVNFKQSFVDLKGWLEIDKCRQPKYWRDKPQVRAASYWTPQSDLKPMLELITL
jgi:hypothetical protein